MAAATTETSNRPPQASGLCFNLGIICLFLSVVCYRTSYTLADHDLWGHIKVGQDVLRTGQIVQADSYSYLTAGQRWINHEWLAQAILAWTYDRAGTAGLIGLKVAVSLLLFGLLYRLLYRQGLSVIRAMIVLILVLIPLLVGLQTVRPQVFTYLLFLIVLFLVRALDAGRQRWLWVLPILFIVWANLHGGFVAGLGVLWLWLAAHLVTVLRETRQRASLFSFWNCTTVLILILSGLATLCNPYGIHLWDLVIRNGVAAPREIVEWVPLSLVSIEGAAYLVLLLVCVAGLLGSRRARSPALIVVFICIAMLPLLAARHLALFALASVVLTGDHIADAWDRWSSAGSQLRAGVERLLGVLSLAGAVALVALSLPNFRCIHLDPAMGFSYPVRAVALLKQSEVNGNLAIDYSWGEYALWHLGPRIKVSVDGRSQTVYSDAVYLENLHFMQGVGDWDALIRRPETDMVLVNKTFPAFNLMKLKPGWVLAYEDDLCALLVRENSPALERLKATTPPDVPDDGAGTCFP